MMKVNEAHGVLLSFMEGKIKPSTGNDQQVRVAIEIMAGDGNPSRGRKILAQIVMLLKG